MKRLHVERVIVLAALLLLWFCMYFVFTVPAHAQGGGFIWSERSSSTPAGMYTVAWNATGSTILDGTVVMSDTTSATVQPQIPLGKGFRTFIAGSDPRLTVPRIIGVTLGNVPGYSQGRILVYGWHNHVLMAATGYTGMMYLRPSLSVSGALASWINADSTNAIKPVCGQFQRYATTTSLYGYCKVDFRHPTTLGGGKP